MLFVENEGLPKMSENMNKHATKRYGKFYTYVPDSFICV